MMLSKHCHWFCLLYLLIQHFISLASSQFSLVSTDEFSIDNGDIFNLPNSPKSSSLKFSLHGAQVESARWKDDSKTVRTFQLSDGNLIHFEVKTHANVTEWKFNWKLKHISQRNQSREVCFHYGHNGEFWFSTHYSKIPKWPMAKFINTNRRMYRRNYKFGVFEFYSEFRYIMEYLFVNSDGFALLLDEHCPWFIRYDSNEGDPIMCFATDQTFPYYDKNEDPSYLDIKFYIFASTNIRTVTDHVVHHANLIPKPSKLPPLRNFVYPVFETNEKNAFQKIFNEINKIDEIDEGLLFSNPELLKSELARNYSIKLNMSESMNAFADNIIDNGFSNKSEIMIKSDTTIIRRTNNENIEMLHRFNESNFGKDRLNTSFRELHNRGFQITIGANGWVKIDPTKMGIYFLESVGYQRISKGYGVVDFSHNKSCQWYANILKNLSFEKQIDSFLMKDFIVSPPFKSKHITKYPILFYKRYVECAFKSDVTIKTQIAFRIQHLPVFVQFQEISNFDEALQNLIPNALSVSIGGYSLISPVLYDGKNDPTEEQYIRWVQACALMPRLVFKYIPWIYNHEYVFKIIKKVVSLHAQYSSTIIELARKRITDGSPIIRPMWYVAPEDARTYIISDQYMLGDDILVAPVLHSGQRERMVYLPSGTWIDQRNDRQYIGPTDIKVPVPLEELAYFKRR